jgi:hypothetical protein
MTIKRLMHDDTCILEPEIIDAYFYTAFHNNVPKYGRAA